MYLNLVFRLVDQTQDKIARVSKPILPAKFKVKLTMINELIFGIISRSIITIDGVPIVLEALIKSSRPTVNARPRINRACPCQLNNINIPANVATL